MEDVRALLLRSTTVSETYRKKTRFAVVHWNGPSVLHNGSYRGDIPTLQTAAEWHVINNGWDGLAYTYAIGREGVEYQTRLWTVKLPHSGNSLMNNEAFVIFMLTGDGDPISDKQFAGLLHRLRATGINRRYWLGHRESPRSTSCPGALIIRWLIARRKEVRLPTNNVRVMYPATIRDEASTLSQKLGTIESNKLLNGFWVLGQPVKGDSLWLELAGDRYVHASAVDSTSYKYEG